MYIFEGFFHIIGSYIHGTRGFAKQIYVNHRIGNFLETNKRNVFETITDCLLKKLLSKMGNILPIHNRQTGFKNIDASKIPVLHQQLLLHNENVLSQIQMSSLITIKDKVKWGYVDTLFFFIRSSNLESEITPIFAPVHKWLYFIWSLGLFE